MSQNPQPGVPATGLERGPNGAYEAYDEQAFRHFLAIERKRAERSGRIVLLLLVHVDERGDPGPIGPLVAVRLFSALTACVRETDFIGWYRTGSVAGAVLMQGDDAAAPGTLSLIGRRVTAMLREGLPSVVGQRIQVRVVHVSDVEN